MLGVSKELYSSAIEDINKFENIDFVLFSGDIVNSPKSKNFDDFIALSKKIKINWYSIIGNHEQHNKYELSQNLMDSLHTQRESFVIEKNDYVILMMNVAFVENQKEPVFSEKMLNILDRQLSLLNGKKVIIVQHFPVFKTEDVKKGDIVNSKDYLKILDKHSNVIAVLSGHYHFANNLVKDNIVFITAPALIEYPNAYYKLTFGKNNQERTVIRIETISTSLKFIRFISQVRSFIKFKKTRGKSKQFEEIILN